MGLRRLAVVCVWLGVVGGSSSPPPAPCLEVGPHDKVWNSNQTHELHLPLQQPQKNSSCDGACNENILSWEDEIDIQSGDVLLVYLNETLLLQSHASSSNLTNSNHDPTTPASDSGINPTTVDTTTSSSNTTTSSNSSGPSSNSTVTEGSGLTSLPPTTPPPTPTLTPTPTVSVYVVSRPGPPSCDVSEGSLVDVSPLTLDSATKLLTFYDKDLTEGVNLLIIVGSAWGGHCVKLKVTVKSENCGDNEDCSGKGVCYTNSSMEGYECQCCPGYIGSHCEEKDACFPSPCLNNGICVDISQGHDGSKFQCLCPYGFTGKICEDTSDPCKSGPCQNGGKCLSSNETAQQFKCECPPNFTGPHCQSPLHACLSSPCAHGVCVEQPDGYRCFCQQGFTGSRCEQEWNECASSPCQNGGTCTDHIDSYNCNCGRGYTGKRCQVKVDLCDPNPCSHHHYCVDKGNSYSCECPKGYTGPECLIPTRAACTNNQCRNGGTCWTSLDSFYCACRPGFTGKICNEEVFLEAIPSSSDMISMSDPDDQAIDLQMPVSIHLDHLHNVYVAAGTLACALLIVILTVVVCHCRMHETYKHCCSRTSPLIPCHISRLDSVLKKNNGMERDKEPLAASRPFPALDSSDMYYALDFSDSQSSPLIQ